MSVEAKVKIVPFIAHDKNGKLDIEGDYLVLKIHKVMLGSMANHLKSTSDQRKASRSMRRLGYVIADAANSIYAERDNNA